MQSSKNQTSRKNTALLRLCTGAMFMAMYIVCCSFSIPVPGGHLYLNDVVICAAAILLDPLSAFLTGGIGAFLGDLIFYPLPMFVSLVTHGIQALVISLIAHYCLKKHPVLASGIGVTVGVVIMVTGYTLGKIFVYSTLEYAMLKLPYEILQGAVGAVLGMLLCWKCGLVKAAGKIGVYYIP